MAILSIQSHVVYGNVGNKAAVFPLQCMGYDVWPIHTVQFSNHTGYGKWEGEVFSAEHVLSVAKGLEGIGVTERCQAVLSGYIGSAAIAEAVWEIQYRVKQLNPSALYLCDPVIGNTHCFVHPEVLDFFKNHLRADIITPNQFEAETLSGIKINSREDLRRLTDYFHSQGIMIVVITGLKISDLDGLHVFVSDQGSPFLLTVPEYDFDKVPLSGTGDLLSALFLGSYLKTRKTDVALRFACDWMDQVIQNTLRSGQRELQVTSVRYGS
jgi:pyridoxine kinase